MAEMPARRVVPCPRCDGRQRLRDARGEYVCWNCSGNGTVLEGQADMADARQSTPAEALVQWLDENDVTLQDEMEVLVPVPARLLRDLRKRVERDDTRFVDVERRLERIERVLGLPERHPTPAPTPPLPAGPLAPRGCICPPGADATCSSVLCPRQAWNAT